MLDQPLHCNCENTLLRQFQSQHWRWIYNCHLNIVYWQSPHECSIVQWNSIRISNRRVVDSTPAKEYSDFVRISPRPYRNHGSWPSLQNRRDFLRKQRRKRGEREARVAREGRSSSPRALASRSPRFRLCLRKKSRLFCRLIMAWLLRVSYTSVVGSTLREHWDFFPSIPESPSR